jgi:hypothetical protein
MPLIIISIALLHSLARHPHCRHATSGGGGEDHTNPVRNPTLATTTGATFIVAAFAACATRREGLVQRRAGFQCPADSLRRCGGGCCRRSCSRRHPPCQPTVVEAAAACRWWKQRQCWQCSNKVNDNNDNNMTTAQQPTRQPTRQPARRGNK